MKITGYPEPPTEFGDLAAGDVFMFMANTTYMKVYCDVTDPENSYINAVNLETGEGATFSRDVLVQPAKDATCMITW